mgnify:CR=1 FL=1
MKYYGDAEITGKATVDGEVESKGKLTADGEVEIKGKLNSKKALIGS